MASFFAHIHNLVRYLLGATGFFLKLLSQHTPTLLLALGGGLVLFGGWVYFQDPNLKNAFLAVCGLSTVFLSLIAHFMWHKQRTLEAFEEEWQKTFGECKREVSGLKDLVRAADVKVDLFQKDLAEFQNNISDDEIMKIKDELGVLRFKLGISKPDRSGKQFLSDASYGGKRDQ